MIERLVGRQPSPDRVIAHSGRVTHGPTQHGCPWAATHRTICKATSHRSPSNVDSGSACGTSGAWDDRVVNAGGYACTPTTVVPCSDGRTRSGGRPGICCGSWWSLAAAPDRAGKTRIFGCDESERFRLLTVRGCRSGSGASRVPGAAAMRRHNRVIHGRHPGPVTGPASGGGCRCAGTRASHYGPLGAARPIEVATWPPPAVPPAKRRR
jgi:hypothetical protein